MFTDIARSGYRHAKPDNPFWRYCSALSGSYCLPAFGGLIFALVSPRADSATMVSFLF